MSVISFVNMKGGVAKTTLAVNIAVTLTMRFDKRVLLIDLDPQFNATQCILSGDEYTARRDAGQPTVYDLFADGDDVVPHAVYGVQPAHPRFTPDTGILQVRNGLHMILGDLNLYRLEFGSGMGREKVLANFIAAHALQDRYDYILIDCPPTPSVWMISALLASQYYLVPIKPEPLSTVGIDLFYGLVNRIINRNHGHEVNCAGIIFSLAEERTNVFRQTKAYFEDNATWRDKIFTHKLDKRTAIARAQEQQVFMLDVDDDCRQMIVNITQEFMRRIR